MKVSERNPDEIEERSFGSSMKLEHRSEIKDALAQLKVVEFRAYAAGPYICKYLANLELIDVEVKPLMIPPHTTES